MNPTSSASVSVVVCAYTEKRWSILVRACESIRRQLTPGDELVLVIDNNEALLKRAIDGIAATLVVASDDEAGLSGARNTGVAAASGDIVAFLDDDAVARDGWLEHIRSAFAEPSTMVVGTTVIPRWQGGRAPSWFPAEFGWVVGCGYTGQPTEQAPVRNPIGASMAVRRSAFELVGGFSTLIGRVGALPVGCEETEFCIRLAQRVPGARVIFDPAAAVDHFVPKERQTVRYFLRRCFHEGRSKRAVARLSGPGHALAAEKTYVRAVLPAAVLRGISDAAPMRSAAVIGGLVVTTAGFLLP